MNANELSKLMKSDMDSSLQDYFDLSQKTAVGDCLNRAGLSPEQKCLVEESIRHALTDTYYTILLYLDGCASVGGDQQNYKVIDEKGDVVFGPGDLEAEAWEAFQND